MVVLTYGSMVDISHLPLPKIHHCCSYHCYHLIVACFVEFSSASKKIDEGNNVVSMVAGVDVRIEDWTVSVGDRRLGVDLVDNTGHANEHQRREVSAAVIMRTPLVDDFSLTWRLAGVDGAQQGISAQIGG
ncbi:hypothetical protein ACLOJK_035370 [Asimina triloba]